ncbi:DUF7520 family protein [Natrinema gelatinilyticum]|uniref:DUF7520 family protein n=1 Tax=Natrinema gelatinilyticum TaxID=2961571 RepID=UPI0020C38643|nr:hypothetical protein [Natrinema gelatinilyticum]
MRRVLVLTDRTVGGRTVVAGLGLALVAATAAFGALLGATLPRHLGVEEMSLFALAIPITPLTFAVYGAAAMGSMLLAVGLVVRVLSRFDDAV